MVYTENDFKLQVDGNNLQFIGKLEKSDYQEISQFLEKVDKETDSGKFIIDLKKLSFLNSSGIRTLATFIMTSDKDFEIVTDTEITWQNESIPALTCIKPEGIKIIS